MTYKIYLNQFHLIYAPHKLNQYSNQPYKYSHSAICIHKINRICNLLKNISTIINKCRLIWERKDY